MTKSKIKSIVNALKNGKGKIKHWYSPRKVKKSLIKEFHDLGVKVEQRKREKNWYELDFSL